jgi:hypothetical protein
MKTSSRAVAVVLCLAFVLFGATPAYAYGPTPGGGGGATIGSAILSSVSATAVRGGKMTFAAKGFKPFEVVSNVAHSANVQLPNVQADAAGDYTDTVTMPSSLLPGSHELVATGLTSGVVAVLPFTITGSVATPKTATLVPHKSGSNLTLFLAIAAGALVVVGCGILLAKRRRDHDPKPA